MENQGRSGTPILMIVDDPVKIEALEKALKAQSLEIVKAATAAEDLDLVRLRTFALIIVDMDMPGVDGFETVRRIRESLASRAIPILFISSIKPRESDLHRGYHLGIVDYLYAPLDSRSLNSKVELLARIYREAADLREDALNMKAQAEDFRKNAEESSERLRQGEENLRLIFENARDYGIFMMDTEGRVSTWNPGAERLLGYSAEEIIGQEASILFTPEDRESDGSKAEMEAARRNGRAEDEKWHVRKDGSRFWASGIMSSIKDEKGDVRGFVKIMRDFTDREIAREQLRQSEERYRTLVEEIQDYAIILLDPSGVVSSWNKGLERIIGYRSDEILGRHFSVFYTQEDLAIGMPEQEMNRALKWGRNKEVGWRIRKDGSRFWGEEIVSPIRGKDGVLTGFTKVTRDITHQKEIDEARSSQVRYLEGMSEISRVIEQNLEMERVLQMAVESVLELFQGDRAFLIHPLDSSPSEFRIPYLAEKPDLNGMAGLGESALAEFHRALAFDHHLLESSDPVVMEPGKGIPGIDDLCGREYNGSMVAVAMRPKNGEPWALGIHLCSSGKKWSSNELRLVKDIAQRLTGVLDNLILHRNLQASEKRFRWLVENTTEIVWRIDLRTPISTALPEDEQLELFYRNGFLAECNDAMAKRYRYSSAADIIGVPIGKILPKTESGNIAYLRNFIRTKYRYLDSESVEQDKNGGARYILSNLVGILDGGYLTGAWGTSRDITDRRLAQEEVRRSRDQLDIILQGIADAIMVYSPSGNLVYFNQATSRMLDFPLQGIGPDSLKAADAEALISRIEIMDESGKPMDREMRPIQKALHGLETPPTLLRFKLFPSGSERWLISRAKPILDESGNVRMVICIAQDTTELRKIEEQFRQSQKMEAIGRLAGGVAHDFNNLLTAINGYSELLLAMTEDEDQRRPYLEEIRKAGERAASLTNQLLVYSRRQIVSPKIVNLNSVVSQMETMLRRLIGEDIDLMVRLSPDLDSIKADPGQIEQVILNLAVNSRDAMPKGGRLALETEPVQLHQGHPGINENIVPGRYVRLTVSDSGMGMEDSVKSHLFEPFFTTKKMGRGTGLGLSTVYGIVRQSGGYVGVETEKGHGTAFKVYFPAATSGPKERSPREIVTERTDLGGSETILVVEDDYAVRNLVKDILANHGYAILEAGNGLEALEAANGFKGKIDLLLTDVIMAQMGGRELTDRMKLLRPDLKTIYMSGYTDDAVVRHGVFAKTEPFLQKPFSPENLARKVRQVLDSVPA